ncbi:family 10 glycosylhydrolase [Clostridium sp.]|uniref:glycoside hydrolase family 10 protein n=1 Tax=Clostridium sp. TaxID=1506 RepID=UPI002913898E|nr:family 10 glycosylhydrolase [Clostridium sp.]MDU5106391.1 family 10 glycosylhydrolase [Clostridium sp.]
MKKKALTLFLLASLSTQFINLKITNAMVNESPLYNFKSYDFNSMEVIYDETTPIYLNSNKTEQITIPNEYKHKKEDFRTAWLSTVVNIDINPVTQDPNLSAEEEFKLQLNSILDKFQELNFNAVTFQVSPMLDAWYPSEVAPWSQYLHSGGSDYTYQGKDPGFNGFDPLEWLISETHNRGMEFHAWFNPYRVTNNPLDERTVEEKLNDLDANNFARKNPHLVYTFQNKLFLDPGEPEVINYAVARVSEVANKYDVDAIHFDDYFYPYKYSANGQDVFFYKQDLDKETYEKYATGYGEYNYENAAKWREDNVTNLVRAVSNAVTNINNESNKSIQFGISPFGIWGHFSDYPEGSVTPVGSTSSLRDQFADTRKWVKDGLVDYLTPQIYWAFNTSAAPYGELVKWWNDQFQDVTNSHLYIGHPNYKYIDASWDNNFKNPYEIANQLKYNQKFENVKGSAYFSFDKLLDKTVQTPGDKFDVLNHSNTILKNQYLNVPANTPGKPWLDKVETVPVSNPSYIIDGNAIKLSWTDTNTDSKFYAIYRQEGSLNEVDITNPENLIARFGTDLGTEFIDTNVDSTKVYTYAVTVIDKASVENNPTLFNKEDLDLKIEANNIIEAINKLPKAYELSLNDEKLIIDLRNLVTLFNNDSYITNLDKLIEAENKLLELKETQRLKEKAAIDAIAKLPDVKKIKLKDEAAVVKARELVTIANNDSAITNLDKLVKAEKKIAELKDKHNKNKDKHKDKHKDKNKDKNSNKHKSRN